jgi:chemotaxis protein methyltransferase CheR
MIKLAADEQKAFTQYIYSVTAIALDSTKGYLIEGRLSGIASELGCRTFTELLERARADSGGGLQRKIIDAITTKETLFFRDTGPFDMLRHKILPELIERRARAGGRAPIRIWSAACSTGQEVYSIAIVLKEVLGDPERYGVFLLGTDISNEAVARASRGVYNETEIARGLGGGVRERYFQAVSGGWKIRDEIRAMASFRTLNLMQDLTALGRFDVVFCRNVAIYFTESDRAALFTRIGRMLEPGGCVIVGAMESLSSACPQYAAHRHMHSVYYTLKQDGPR